MTKTPSRFPGGGAGRRLLLEALGWVLVVVGVAALVLPGPGLLMLLGGLSVLSRHYTWAQRCLVPVETRAKEAAASSVQSWPRILTTLSGALGVAAAGAVWGLRPPVPSWWPVAEAWWLPGGWAAGGSLIGSAVVALALVGYSYRTFRVAVDASVARSCR